MAPFNTHFLIAEKIWPELSDRRRPYYGQFCFGCVAPDADKLSATLTQKDTHFFDRSDGYDCMASRRTAAFLEARSESFAQLAPAIQAFELGYLCHLAVDELSKHMWRRETWRHVQDLTPSSAFAALDEQARAKIQNYPAIRRAVCEMPLADFTPLIPQSDLARMHAGICAFLRAGDVEDQFLSLADLFARPDADQRRFLQERFRAEIEEARNRAHIFELDRMSRAGLTWSRRRLADLLAGRTPPPAFPDLDVCPLSTNEL